VDETPDARSGYVVLGRLLLSRIARDRLVRLARARGMTPLQLAREVVTAWVIAQMEV
jgi:hypothetical protein